MTDVELRPRLAITIAIAIATVIRIRIRIRVAEPDGALGDVVARAGLAPRRGGPLLLAIGARVQRVVGAGAQADEGGGGYELLEGLRLVWQQRREASRARSAPSGEREEGETHLSSNERKPSPARTCVRVQRFVAPSSSGSCSMRTGRRCASATPQNPPRPSSGHAPSKIVPRRRSDTAPASAPTSVAVSRSFSPPRLRAREYRPPCGSDTCTLIVGRVKTGGGGRARAVVVPTDSGRDSGSGGRTPSAVGAGPLLPGGTDSISSVLPFFRSSVISISWFSLRFSSGSDVKDFAGSEKGGGGKK